MSEEQIQEDIADYINVHYGLDVIFHHDYGDGAKLTYGQAIKRYKQNGGRRGFPDLQICQPIDRWHSFFLEIKKEGIRIVKRNGTLVADQHIRSKHQ